MWYILGVEGRGWQGFDHTLFYALLAYMARDGWHVANTGTCKGHVGE